MAAFDVRICEPITTKIEMSKVAGYGSVIEPVEREIFIIDTETLDELMLKAFEQGNAQVIPFSELDRNLLIEDFAELIRDVQTGLSRDPEPAE